MSKHTWTAIFTVQLTDKEAARAYTFDYHGRKVIASRFSDNAERPLDGVMVGCYECELTYAEALNKPCISDDTIKSQI